MSFEALAAHYGLIAIFAGAGIEGEAVVLTGGVLAHRGLLPIWGVAACAAAGSCLVDQGWFWIARRFRDHPRVAAIRKRPGFTRVLRLLERYPIPVILCFRFVWGMRTITPIAVAASGVRARTFVLFNLISAAIWGPAIAWAGYLFGRALDPWLKDVRWFVIALATLALIAGMVALLRRYRGDRATPY